MKNKTENLLPKILPGAVCAQMVRCGKSNCKCSKGMLHGPYYYHFYRLGGALVKHYLRADEIEETREACDNWRKIKSVRRDNELVSRRRLRTLGDLLRSNEEHLAQLVE